MSTSVNTSSPEPRTGEPGERTIGQLVSDASQDVSQIVRNEVELAKAEIKQDVSHAAKGAGMFAGAGLFALYGLGLLFLGLAGVIAIWLPWWAGLLIMAGVLFLITLILALIGRGQVKKVKGKPEQAITEGQTTVEKLKASAQPPHRADGLIASDGATAAAVAMDETGEVIGAPGKDRSDGATSASATDREESETSTSRS